MWRFRKQVLSEANTGSTRCKKLQKDRFSDSSTRWTFVSVNLTGEKYGIKHYYDQIYTPHGDMCFSNI